MLDDFKALDNFIYKRYKWCSLKAFTFQLLHPKKDDVEQRSADNWISLSLFHETICRRLHLISVGGDDEEAL